jgi:ribosomal protein L44E
MNRKQRRSMKKLANADATEKLSDKVAQFSKLPEQCSACQKSFDKQDGEMIKSWSVVVKQDVVRLFCPECIKATQEALNGSY